MNVSLTVTRTLHSAVPARWRLPLRYRWMRLRGTIEPELRHLADYLEPGHVAIDVGANHGVWSYRLARLSSAVEAFEPQPWCADTLASWGSPRVHVHREGLSDADGELTLAVPQAGGKPLTGYATFEDAPADWQRVPVPVRRLDDFGFTDVGFVKIDVEGHERAVLRGAAETVRREKPVLVIEVEQRHLGTTPVGDVLAEVEALGYGGWFLLDGVWTPLAAFDYAKHQAPYENDTGNAAYVNNFLFLPAGGRLSRPAG